MPQRNSRAFSPCRTSASMALCKAAPRLLAFLFLLNVCGTASAETWTLAWNPSTAYEDGTPITGKTVTYAIYWSTDPGTVAPMTPIATGVTQTYATFDPEPQGMVPGKTVYFRMKTVLDTGEASDYSAALAWVVPGTAPQPTLNGPGTPANLTIGGAASPASGAWKLAWDPVTKRADGQDLPKERIVRYSAYWTRDPSLATGSLIPLALSIAIPFAEFDPPAEGMDRNERVYFTVMSTLDTGEESGASEALAWRVSNKGPAPPAKGKIVKRN